MKPLTFTPGVAVVAVLLSLGLTGCLEEAGQAEQTREEPVRLVRVETASSQALTPSLSFAGEVKARYESQPGFRVSGKLITRDVDVGDAIKPGQVLAKLDDKDLKLQVDAAKASLSRAQAEYRLAEQNYNRYQDLQERGVISRAEYDQAVTTLESARQAVSAASAQLDQARNQLGYATLVADYDGVVSAVNAEVGQVLSAGQPLLYVERSGEREIEIDVPEQQREQIQNADQIDVSLWALPGREYQARLRELAPSADPVTRTYAVRLSLLNADEAVKPGMTASVTFNHAGGDAIVLPLSALYTKTDQPQVWRVDVESNTVQPVDVKTGELVGNHVTIAGGISPGDKIVTAGANLLIPGQKVRLMEEKP